MKDNNDWKKINSLSDLPQEDSNDEDYVAYNTGMDFFYRWPCTASFLAKMFQAREVTHWAYVGIDKTQKPID